MNVLAITPARGGSKGIPRKNIKYLQGKPLLQYTIEAAQACSEIDVYIVNSEDPEIRQVAEALGVQTQGRPEEFWYDNTFQEVDRLLLWSIQDMEKKIGTVDIVVLLYATAPLRRAEHIAKCIDLVKSEGFDSALTLYEKRSYLWRVVQAGNVVEPINYDPHKRGPNQLEGWNQWVENKAVYACKRDLLFSTGCRLGGRIGFVAMEELDSIDIDTLNDFNLAGHILQTKQ